MTTDFEAFEKLKLNEGFDEVLIRTWEPNFSNEKHTHPFDTEAVVVKGEFWLTIGKEVRHLRIGDHFKVPRDVLHSEKYGPEGAVFWAARKN
jgi:quercetin dioxygenase-like cupin family protein